MILHVRVLPVAKPKSCRATAPRPKRRKNCKKAKETRDTANSASSGTLQSWQRASSFEYKSEKSSFLQKNAFCSKCKDRIGHVGAGLARSLSCCHFLCVLGTATSFFTILSDPLLYSYGMGSRSGGAPERVFLHFFRKGFRTRVCTEIIWKLAQERRFFATSKQMYKKSYRARGMRPPQGPAFVRNYIANSCQT